MEKIIKKNDVVIFNFTTYIDNKIVDTNSKKIAERYNLQIEGNEELFKPKEIIIGEHMVVKGLDSFLIGKKLGRYKIKLKPEDAFGKKNPQLVQIVSESTLKRFKIVPRVGLIIEVDGKIGVIKNVSSGRIIVDFNHPFAGKEVVYDIDVLDIKEDDFIKTKILLKYNGFEKIIDIEKDNEGNIILRSKKEINDKIKQIITTKIKHIGVKRIIFKNNN